MEVPQLEPVSDAVHPLHDDSLIRMVMETSYIELDEYVSPVHGCQNYPMYEMEALRCPFRARVRRVAARLSS